MSDAPVLLERHEAVCVLRMNVPARRNALSVELREALIAALEGALAAPDVRAIVLTGTATSFCAGGDLETFPGGDALAVRARMQRGQHLVRLIATGRKPVIAAVNGGAHGAGLSLAAACDVVIASDSAKFGAVFAKVGLMADLGLLWSLPQRIGVGQTRRLLYGALVIDADEAHRLGLVDERVADAALLDAALACARGFATSAPGSIALTKSALARSCASLEEVFAVEVDGQALLGGTQDFAEGRAAFKERRTARFEGR